MTKQELIKAVIECKELLGFVLFTSNDGIYVKLVKSDFLRNLRESDDNAEYQAQLYDNGKLFIN